MKNSNNTRGSFYIHPVRLFYENPLAFWRYRSYFDKNNERYVFPYKVKRTLRNGRKKLLIV